MQIVYPTLVVLSIELWWSAGVPGAPGSRLILALTWDR